jgi:hypothetical protein
MKGLNCHAFKRNRQEECVQMPVKIARSAPSTIVRAARAAGSHPHLASVLLQGRKSANIHASSEVIRGNPGRLLSQLDRPAGHLSRLSARHLADRSSEHGRTSSYPPRMPLMLTPRSALLVLLFSLLIASTWEPGRAATSYYFSASGSDSNNCRSPASPCRTIGKMNSLTYAAGDSILFHGGDSFTGCVMINPTSVPNNGSASNPITLDSYGSGNATLLSNCPGNLHALLTIDAISGVTVQNLILSANGSQTAAGIMVQNSFSSTAIDTILIQNNDISGFNCCGTTPGQYSAEIFIAGQAYATGGNCGPLNNIQVLNNKLHGAAGPTSPDDNGITGNGCGQNVTNVKYSGNTVWNIGGHAYAPGGTSGNGIVANQVNGGELSFNLVHDNGANVNTCGGPGGVWAFSSNNVTIKFNEVYNMRPLSSLPPGACDWVAYDLDAGVTNSIVEYNYSHDNAGAGVLMYAVGAWGPNTVRYNVSKNDDNLLASGSGALALVPGGVAKVYNNSIYRTGSIVSTTPPSCLSFGSAPGTVPAGTLFANNLCVISATDQFNRTVYIDAGVPDVSAVTIVNNLYFNPNGYNHWSINADYDGLAAVQAGTGKEMGSIVATSSPVVNGGAGGTCTWSPPLANGPQPCPAGYALPTGSTAIGAGVNLIQAPYNLNVGTRDYWGNTIPHTFGSGYNMGADGGRH